MVRTASGYKVYYTLYFEMQQAKRYEFSSDTFFFYKYL